MTASLTIALGMLLVLEGLLPFLFPRQWREAFLRIAQLADGQIRFFGLIALVCGILLLAFNVTSA